MVDAIQGISVEMMAFMCARLRAAVRSVFFWAAVLILTVIAGLLLYDLRTARLAPAVALGGELTMAQKTAIQTALDLYKLIVNWAITLVGGTALFLRLGLERGESHSVIDLLLAAGIFFMAILSVYFGHVALDLVSALLAVDQFPLDKQPLIESSNLQYLFFLAALALFSFFAFHFFWSRSRSGRGASRHTGPRGGQEGES